jgi:hypothetical protein
MAQQRTKSNLTSIVHRDDARPWDDFVTEPNTTVVVENDVKRRM